MNLRDQNMAATNSMEPIVQVPPSRPAIQQPKPIDEVPGAPISTANMPSHTNVDVRSKRPANGYAQPKHVPPGAPFLGDEGDQASRRAKPKKSSPDRIHPPVAGDETTGGLQPNDRASRRNSSGESRGIDQPRHETHWGIVDANHPGLTGRDEANGAKKPNADASRHDSISDGHFAIETHDLNAVAGDSLGQYMTATHSADAETIAEISPDQSAIETQYRNVGAGDQRAHSPSETQTGVSPLIAEITQLVRMRRRWHKAEKSLTLQGKALCRSWTNGDKDEANAAYDRAADGKPDDPMLAMALAPFLDAKARFETERGAIEKTLRKLARTLPVWKSWAEGVKGLGDLRLAVIVGECGDIGSYRNPSCFWKRMGLAVIGGQRQRRVTDAAEALEHGYNPERRAIAYVMSTELIKAQVRRIKDEPETALRPASKGPEPIAIAPDAPTSTAIGPYGQLYLDRKAYEASREGITKAHANNRASRYLAKRVLRDLYSAWRSA